MKINTEVIKQLNPCQDRLDNWMKFYPKFNGDVSKFFKLENITYRDKLWVILRLVSNDIKVIFALDCVFSTVASTVDAVYVAYNAADAAHYAAYAVHYAAYADTYYTNNATCAAYYTAYGASASATDVKKEEQNQLKVLLYLIKGEKK